MKKTLVLLAVATCSMTSCMKSSHGVDDMITQQKGIEDNPNGGGGNNTTSVPATVLMAFNARYPDATNIQWKVLSDGNFKAEFFRGTVKWQAIFTPSGSLMKQEHN